ncbi:MAG: 2'-5' RNA ligase family protein [Flavobacterium sp.]|uniref:2'-5' RNA ligase family protein n=1 Tax=Flavobacterium sp. TaxID=239 RepID=UPI003263344E
MKPTPQFSLVIFPTPEQSALINSWKQLLKNKIKWFNSADSAAHITVIQFENEMELSLYIDAVRECCKTFLSQKVTFNSLGSFENAGTFFIAPDALSKIYLDTLIIDMLKFLGFKVNANNVNSHMSIARKIYGERMITAFELFKPIDVAFQFNCDALHVRKFDGKQYSDIIEKIPFGK